MTIQWLGDEVVRRHSKHNQSFDKASNGDTILTRSPVQMVRRARGGVILDPDDIIRDVLDDNDFVVVGKNSDC